MNDLQIEYFLAAAETRSFTKAAEEKYVSQPAISKQIAAMEEELGVTLFERTKKATSLTMEGQMYYDFFQRRREEMARITRQAQVAQKQSLQLRIGVVSGWMLSSFLPGMLESVVQKYPQVRISLMSLGFLRLPLALTEHEVDLIITVEESMGKLPLVEARRISTTSNVIIYSKNHRLAKKENVQIADFRRETFLSPIPEETGFYPGRDKANFTPLGFEPKVRVVRNNESLVLNVLCGLGVAIADQLTWQTYSQDLLHLPIDHSLDVVAAWRKSDINPALELFLKSLQEYMSKKSAESPSFDH